MGSEKLQREVGVYFSLVADSNATLIKLTRYKIAATSLFINLNIELFDGLKPDLRCRSSFMATGWEGFKTRYEIAATRVFINLIIEMFDGLKPDLQCLASRISHLASRISHLASRNSQLKP